MPRSIDGNELNGLLGDAGCTPSDFAAFSTEQRSIFVPIIANAVLTDCAVADITESRPADPSSLVTCQGGPEMLEQVLVKSDIENVCCDALIDS